MSWIKDTIERVVVTFLEGWLAAWIVVEDVTADQLFNGTVLTVGLVAAVGAFLKALAATRVGREDSASLAD